MELVMGFEQWVSIIRAVVGIEQWVSIIQALVSVIGLLITCYVLSLTQKQLVLTEKALEVAKVSADAAKVSADAAKVSADTAKASYEQTIKPLSLEAMLGKFVILKYTPQGRILDLEIVFIAKNQDAIISKIEIEIAEIQNSGRRSKEIILVAATFEEINLVQKSLDDNIKDVHLKRDGAVMPFYIEKDKSSLTRKISFLPRDSSDILEEKTNYLYNKASKMPKGKEIKATEEYKNLVFIHENGKYNWSAGEYEANIFASVVGVEDRLSISQFKFSLSEKNTSILRENISKAIQQIDFEILGEGKEDLEWREVNLEIELPNTAPSSNKQP